MSKHQVTSKQAPSSEEEMAVPSVDLSSKVYDDDDDAAEDAAAAEDDGPKVVERIHVVEFLTECSNNLRD